ncbi:MAG TPA: ABC-F family ATP-binding cassette domain-containing protein, partial [Caldithrix sp.]|nr:ABC-F family ATP-binding cassette domain-containing protein [Caldithrix sp.]
MLQLQNINYAIGNNHLLKNVQWIINPKKRVALIGSNGAGKTTLFRIIAGEIMHYDGSIIKPKGYQIGYLPQEEIAITKGSVISIVLEGHDEILKIEEEMDSIHQSLETNSQSNHNNLLERLGVLESRYSVLGGYVLESQAKKILMGLGFSEVDFQRPISELSGGWQMRAFLARLLLQEPDVLLLDEPTNHLDLESLEWIESYLRNFSGSMVIISHDRFFIDRLAQEIVELDRGKLTHYAGGYQFYKQKKELEQEQLIKKWEEQKEERIRIQRFIDRFRYKNTKAAQVQSRIKMLDKMETIELPDTQRTIHFKIQADTVSFKEALQIKHLAFRYTGPWVLQDINLNMYRGEKVALVGVNGAGKTTLTRLISKELHPQQGELKLGERVHVGYYAQHQIDSLNLKNTIFKEVEETAARSFQPKLRDILGIFQFTGDTVEKSIGVLSGGEKARVSLAKILLSPCNFLIMD